MGLPHSLAFLLSLLFISTSLGISVKDAGDKATLPFLKNRYIVEVDSISESGFQLETAHNQLYESLKSRDVAFVINKEFDYPGIFVGVSMSLEKSEDAVKLTAAPGVRAIRPLRLFPRPDPINGHVVSNPKDLTYPPDSQSTHVLTGVDKLHAQGIAGQGIKIGIIDTGIDYTHPALGGGFGPGHKVSGGFDFVGDDYNGANNPIPDSDPLDQCNGHGTHVAGIIGADPLKSPFNISGVAYSASLSSYRIFGCKGQVTDDVIIDALLRGVKDGQDILSLSLGGTDGWTESSASVVASRIADSGTVVIIAAGNDGDSGSWYSSSPGNGINVISVGSVDNTAVPIQTATVQGATHDPIPYYELFPFPITDSLPIYATSNDTTVVDDACNPLPDSTPDLSPYLVVVRRGSCTFAQKLTNIAAKGGNLTFIYDNGSGFTAIDVGEFNATLIQAADGEFLVEQFVSGAPITISFPQTGGEIQFQDPAGGLISSFTSYGPTNDFFFKPAVAAPGGNILSTLPVPLGSYGVESGTSMATPFVAGSAALLLQVKGKSSDVVHNIRNLLETTAAPVPSNHTDDALLQTVTQQGAGLINVYNAAYTTTLISPAELILNDTAHLCRVQSFTVRNASPSPKTYRLSHVPAGTAVTVTPGTIFPAKGPVPLSNDFAEVVLSDTTFMLRGGESKTVWAIFTPPSTDPTTFPVFSGFIQVAVRGEAPLHVSYIGLAASLKDKQVIDDTDEFFGVKLPVILNNNGDVQKGPKNYTFNADTGDFPSLFVRLAFGSPVLRADLVDPNIKFNGTLNKRALFGEPVFTFPKKAGGGTFGQVPTVGSVFEFDFIARNNENPDGNIAYKVAIDTPTFANGTTISNGSYRFLLRALRVTGDPEDESDYESWLSPIVGVYVP
ncbi:subtilisin-like protease [Marasmius fiardii PR-910]|nr:subtilisin-like protease [Marasmius fiardii PR-910]